MARFMRSAGGEAEDGVSRVIWSAVARAKQGFDLGGVEVVGLDGAAQAGVDGEVGGDGERGRRGHAGSR